MPTLPQNAPGGARARAKGSKPDPTDQPDTTPPLWLDERAEPAWRAAIDLLTQVRIVAKSDLTALARYCQFLCEWITLTHAIRDNGHSLETKNGPKLNPEVSARTQIEGALRSLEKALGLDPSSYMDLTRDLAKSLTDRNKARGGRGAVGGFLNAKKE